MRCGIRYLSVLVLAFVCTHALAEDWPRFRGPNGAGTSKSSGLPVDFGPGKNEVWKIDVPFGRSSPVIAGKRIFISAVDDGELVTQAIDLDSGQTVWRRTLKPNRDDEFHHDTDSATTTPVTDGSNVYVFFQEFGVVSYDKKGEVRWKKPLGPFRNFYSITSSPLISGKTLYMLFDQAEGSFLVAMHKDSGKELWRRNRPARLENYATPILYPNARKPKALIVLGSHWVDAYDLKTGSNLWALGNLGTGPISSPVLSGDTLFATMPNHAENGWSPFEGLVAEHDADGNGELSRAEVAEAWLSKHFGWLDNDADGAISARDWKFIGESMTNEHWGAFAIRLPGKNGEQEPEILWNYRQNVADIASPLIYDDVFYMVRDGILISLDPKTGTQIKRGRLGDNAKKVYASPIAADGKIYLGSMQGHMIVLRAGGEWEPLSDVDLGDEIWASPAVADGSLYVRTRSSLHRFSQTGR